MKQHYNILLVGAGGIGSYFLPLFLKVFTGNVQIWDKDVLEERNLDRQNFDPKFIGANKASALKLSQLPEFQSRISVKESWFVEDLSLKEGEFDVFIAAPDNHMARLAVINTAERYNLPAIIGGNGTFDSMASVFLPHLSDTGADPRVRYPEITTDRSGSPTEHCTGAAQDTTPQLAFANHRAANQMIQLLFTLKDLMDQYNPDTENLPIELSTSRYGNESRTAKECF